MLSIILPSYNEEKMILTATERVGAIMREAGIDYELLFVDDGSRDRSGEICDEYAGWASISAGTSARRRPCSPVWKRPPATAAP